MSMFIKERNSLGTYIFHPALCKRYVRVPLIPVSRALPLTEFLVVSVWTVTTSQQKRGPTYRYFCIFCTAPSASYLSRIRPIVTRVGDFASIKAAIASGLRQLSQTSIITSKLPFVALIPSVPPPFGFTAGVHEISAMFWVHTALCQVHFIEVLELKGL